MADASLSAMFARDPAAAARYRRLMQAQALTAQSRQPARSHLEGASRLVDALVGGMETGQVEREMRQDGERRRSEREALQAPFLASAVAGQGADAMPAPAEAPAPVTPVSMPAPRPAAGGSDLAARVLLAEAGGEPPEGQEAVARVLVNRAALTGQPLDAVVQRPGQFEGLTRAQSGNFSPEQIARARALLESAQPDPSGPTHFLNPDLQRQMGRAQPAWAPEGQGQRIGNHVFYNRPGDFSRPVGAPELSPASAVLPPPAAQPQPAAVPARAPMFNPQQEQALVRMLASGDPEMERFAQGQMQLAQLRQRQETTPQPGRDVPLSPEVEAQRLRLAQAGRTQVSVPVDASQRAESAEGIARGKTLAEEGERVRLAADTGAGTIDSVRYVRSLAAGTGRLAPAKEVIGGWLDALNINSRLVREAADLQAFTAAASQAVLGRQMEQRGVQTDSDARRMEQTFAQIRNTPQGNEFILRAAEAQATRAMERAEFYQQWRAQRGTLDGALEAWTRVIRETPLVYRGRDGEITFLNEFLASAQATNTPREEALAVWQRNAR